MDALKVRDEVFSAVHSAVLKPRGFKKKGHWSVRSAPPFHWAAYLRASRFGDKSHAVFWIDLLIFNEDWDALLFGPRQFPSLAEGLPNLVGEELAQHCVPPLTTLEIDKHTDVSALTNALIDGMSRYGDPLFERCSSLDSILAYFKSQPNFPRVAHSAAAICLLLNRESEAQELMALAKANAPHENLLRWLESKEAAMWSNHSLRRTSAIDRAGQ